MPILTISPMTAILLLIITLVGISFAGGFIFYTQRKNKMALIGKKLATVLTASGERHDKLLEVDGNQLWDKVKGKLLPYMIRPDKSFDVWWPPGRPRLIQLSVKSFLYAEGNPEPIDPFDRLPVITSEVLGNLQNINFSRAMAGRVTEIVEGPEKIKKARFPLWVLGLIGGGIAGIVGLIYFVL